MEGVAAAAAMAVANAAAVGDDLCLTLAALPKLPPVDQQSLIRGWVRTATLMPDGSVDLELRAPPNTAPPAEGAGGDGVLLHHTWGPEPGLNRRPPEPQSGALTN